MRSIINTLAIVCVASFALQASADNYRPLQFPNNSRPLGFAENYRPLGFDPPPISYPKPVYSLDMMRNHPYNSANASTLGHASQNAGTAKWFRPGYGYRIPAGSARLMRYQSLNPQSEYSNGIRRLNPLRSDSTHRYWTNAYGGPWYFPGSTKNTQTRTFSW